MLSVVKSGANLRETVVSTYVPLTPAAFGTDSPPCPPFAPRASPSRKRESPTQAAFRWSLPRTRTLADLDCPGRPVAHVSLPVLSANRIAGSV